MGRTGQGMTLAHVLSYAYPFPCGGYFMTLPSRALFMAVLDTLVTCWGFTLARRSPDAWVVWTLTVFFGILAAREWYTVLYPAASDRNH
ncbi:MAG: hypothetical protein AB7N91_07170 [Candidatus Tectimicrobiota bacterium]